MKKTIDINIKRLVTLFVLAAFINITAAGIVDLKDEKSNLSLMYRDEYLLIPDSTADVVGLYDPYDGTYLGDLLTVPQIHGTSSTPINAIVGPDGNIYVSDQVQDAVFVFDQSGTFLYEYANNTDGLNNIRGIDFRGNNLFITSGDDYVAEFDGPHSRLPHDFISDGSDPFDIYFLDNGTAILSDIQGTTDNVRYYNYDGSLISILFTVNFPQQIQYDSLSPGDYLNNAFSGDLITDFDIAGNVYQTTFFNNGRGIYRLGNGNLLATAGDGVWEIEPGTGTVIQQKNTGSARFIEYYSTGNSPPYLPSAPQPPDESVDVELDTDISWTGGDPNGDPVTYDVYFDTVTPSNLVSSNQTETNYDPGTLDYETKYYWQIVAWDNQSLSTEGPIWSFTTIELPKIPDLDCSGDLEFIDEIEPGETVTGTITVENAGDEGSLLNWEVESFPDWGNWSFDPESGVDLLAGETVDISIEIVAPDEPDKDFEGEVVLVNSDDSEDVCIIEVSLATPLSQQYTFLELLAQRFPILARILALIF